MNTRRVSKGPASDPGIRVNGKLSSSPLFGSSRNGGGSSCSSENGDRESTLETMQSLNAVYNTSPSCYRVASSAVNAVKNQQQSHTRSLSMGSTPNLRYTSSTAPSNTPQLFSSGDIAASLSGLPENTQSLYMEMQSQLHQLEKENQALRRDMDIKETKLSSCMSSIKTFWSPELKKERQIRKEENQRYVQLKEQFQSTSEENQRYLMTLKQLQDELCKQRGFNCHLQDTVNMMHSPDGDQEARVLRYELDQKCKETKILQKTVEEMELRLETQKHTLGAKDESIHKLLEMIQSKGLSGGGGDKASAGLDDINVTEQLKLQLIEADTNVTTLDANLLERENEVLRLKEEMRQKNDSCDDMKRQLESLVQYSSSPRASTLKAVIEAKDSKIQSLEARILEMDEQLVKLKSSGAVSVEDRNDEIKQVEVYKSHSKFQKNKIEQLKSDLSRRESELITTQTKMDMLLKQHADQQQHIDLLKDALTAKERHMSSLQADIDALRSRLNEKDELIDKKEVQIQSLNGSTDKQSSEVAELREMIDMKDRKLTILQRKLDNIEEQVTERDSHITTLKKQLSAIQLDRSGSDNAVSSLEDALGDKERHIERLKEQRDREIKELRDELDTFQKNSKDSIGKVDQLQKSLTETEAELIDIKENAAALASAKLKMDSCLKTLEITLQQKNEECFELQNKFKRLLEEKTMLCKDQTELMKQVSALEEQVNHYIDELMSSQEMKDKLQIEVKQLSTDRIEKDKQLNNLEMQLKDAKMKLSNMKRNQQTEKKKSAQLLEEARKREGVITDDQTILKSDCEKKEKRVLELEEALRDSVKITAERELALHKQQEAVASLQKQVSEMSMDLEKLRKVLSSSNKKIADYSAQLSEREAKIQGMIKQRRKQLEEVLEMKQEALLSAISEKDANIALIEMSNQTLMATQPNPEKARLARDDSNKNITKLKIEKSALMKQLKEQNERKVMLLQEKEQEELKQLSQESATHSSSRKDSRGATKETTPDQVNEGLLKLARGES